MLLLSIVLLPVALGAIVTGGALKYQARDDGTNGLPWAEKKPAERMGQSSTSGMVTCPDQESECPDGSTCCRMSSGSWACCPYVEAVCCSDQVHCCPNGYTCDLAQETCVKQSVVPATRRPGFEPTSSAPSYGPLKAGTMCPGGSQCPVHAACCRTYYNTYHCCNYPLNVCCDDGLHCCSAGTICQQPTMTCITIDRSVPSSPLEILTAASKSIKSNFDANENN